MCNPHVGAVEVVRMCCKSRVQVLQKLCGCSAQVMLHRPIPARASTDASTRIDRYQHAHRPMQHDKTLCSAQQN